MSVPDGFSSVMAMRAPTDPDDLDFFPTPPWAARAGGRLIKWLDPEAKTCWEPACGEGHMAYGLQDYFTKVSRSDIHDYGIGAEVWDFLSQTRPWLTFRPDWIVTNPPFVKGQAFIEQALKDANRGVAMLLRLSFLEGAGRHKLLYGANPVSVVAPFAERVPMVKGRWDPAASSATAYAWFIWIKPDLNPFHEGPVLRPIAPGTRAALDRPDDALRFGAAAETPLFDGDA